MTAIATALLAPQAPAQVEPPFHEFDPDATKAFEQMIEAHRALPGLTVRSTVTIEIMEGDIASNTSGVQAEFTLTSDKRGLVKLRGFHVHVAEGNVWATHEGNDEAYFTMGDDGSPYYALMAMFMDLPFPHLAIYFGEEDIEELCMQFHSRAPWIRPTGVREEVRAAPRQAADENDAADPDAVDDKAKQRTVRVLTMSSDFEKMELVIDPQTQLIESLELEIAGGGFVQEDAVMVFRQSFENEVHEELPEQQLVFDPGEREQVPELRALVPRPVVAAAQPGGRGGVVGGGLIDRPAPPFTLASLDGGAIDLEELQGQVVVLDFWATWCRPCIRGLTLLHEVQAWARDEALPVRVITVNSLERESTPDERRDMIADFWKQQEFSLPVAIDYTGETAAAYGVQMIPSTFIIRSDGVIHQHHIGADANYVQQIKADVLEAIAALEY